MNDYQGEKNVKKEAVMDSSNAASRLTDTSSILDVSQTIQQLLAMSSIAGSAILSPMQLLQASASSGASTSQLSLPWMMPHHYQQMMVLQQGLTQPFLMSDVIDDKDSHVVVMPSSETVNQYNNISAVSSPAAIPAELTARAASTGQLNSIASGGLQSLVSMSSLSSSDASARLLNYHMTSSQKTTAKENLAAAQLMATTINASPKSLPARHGQTQPESAKMPRPRPPKKPLTPYMLFSKEMWHQVKAANSHLSLVTEIGAIIGSMWRELDAAKKEHYNELFSREKIRYDEEIRLYLKNNNLHPSDLIRARLSKKKDSKALNQHRPQVTSHASAILNPPGQQLVQSLLGYPVVDGSHALVSLDGSLQNNFMQAWAGQPAQQILAQMGLAGQLAHANSDETKSDGGGRGSGDNGIASQPLALQAHQIFSSIGICGNAEQSVQQPLVRSTDGSTDRFRSESGIDATDKSKSWSWSSGQPVDADDPMQGSSSVVYDVTTEKDTNNTGIQTTATRTTTENQLIGHSGEEGSQSTYCAVDDWSQMKHDGDESDKSDEIRHLESRVIYLENALSEKNKEVEKLTGQLEKAHQIIAHFRIQQSIAENQALDQNCSDGITAVVASGNMAHQ